MQLTTTKGRKSGLLVLVTLAALAFGAAVPPIGGAAQHTRKADVTLTFAAQATATVIAFQALAANYERLHPNVKINVVGFPVQDYGVNMQAQFRGGNGPDMLYGAPGTGNPHGLINFAKAGYLADLTKLPFVNRLPANAKPVLGIGTKIYAYPLDVSTFGGVYNIELFNQLGLKLPKNWADVLNLCTQVKAKGKYMFSVSGLVSGTQILTIAGDYVYGPQPNWNALRAAGKVTFAGSPGWHNALQAFVNMDNAGCFQPGAAGYSLGASQALVANGEAVAWPGVSNVIGAIQKLNPKVTLGVFPIPGPTAKQTKYIVGYGNAVGVNAKSPNLATALDFLKFMGRSGQSTIYPNLIGNMSVLQAAQAAKTGKVLLKHGAVSPRYAPWGPLIKAGKTVQIPFVPWPNGQIYSDLTSGTAGLLAHSTTIDAVLQQMDKDYNLGG